MKALLIIGAGGHGKSVAEAADLSGKYKTIGFLDDDILKKKILDIPVLGKISDLSKNLEKTDEVFIAIGSNKIRKTLIQKVLSLGAVLATVIHPSAIISRHATIGRGSVVMPGAVVGTEAQLGIGVIINIGTIVDHDAVVQDYSHLRINSSMTGGTLLNECDILEVGDSI